MVGHFSKFLRVKVYNILPYKIKLVSEFYTTRLGVNYDNICQKITMQLVKNVHMYIKQMQIWNIYYSKIYNFF